MLCLFVAAQLLLAVPAMAQVQAPAGSHHEMPCDELPAGNNSCPCCPNGSDSMKDCLASCTLVAAIAPGISILQGVTTASEAFVDSIYRVTSLSDPPLKPPPIA